MKRSMTTLMLVAAIGTTVSLVGCVQMPTEKQGIADLRPQIAFKADVARTRTAQIQVDNLDFGQVNDYLDGAASLRVLAGTHTLRVVLGGEVLLEEKFYLGDGVNRIFILK